jgi:hypothetical protein
MGRRGGNEGFFAAPGALCPTRSGDNCTRQIEKLWFFETLEVFTTLWNFNQACCSIHVACCAEQPLIATALFAKAWIAKTK